MKWWPKRKDPILHRALGGSNDEKEDDAIMVDDIHQLATKGRVRQKDKMKRNALHVAVRIWID